MPTTNDITGQTIISKVNTKSFQDNFDAIFKKRSQETDTPKQQREVLAPSNGSVSGVDGACSDYGNTDIEYDGGLNNE